MGMKWEEERFCNRYYMKSFSSFASTIPRCELDLSGDCKSNEHESLKCSG